MAMKQVRPRTGLRDHDWDFFSFPVFFGFAGGMLLACLLAIVVPFLFYFMFLASLGLFSFSLAHVVISGSRMRNERTKRAREEEDELEKRILAKRQNADETGTSSRKARRRRRV